MMCENQTIRPILLTAILGLSATIVLPAQPPDAPWVFDVVQLKSGPEFRGFIVNETPTHVNFMTVRRQPGRPTVCLPTDFAKREIAQVTRLSTVEREHLARRVDLLRNEPDLRESRLKQLTLTTVPWTGKSKQALQYQSDWFVLQSDAPETIVRRAALRLEEIYAAFGRFLPARVSDQQTTTVRLMSSTDEYRNYLRSEGRNFVNAGFYDPARKLVVFSCDLKKFGDDLQKLRNENQQIKDDLDNREAALKRLYKGTELLRHMQSIRETRRRIEQADKQNETNFAQATQSLFATLAHEAFHAYVDTGADLPPKSQLPRWLNEGLAQVFESAIVEGGELRLGHADAKRLASVKDMTRRGELMPLVEVLRSKPEQFQNHHGTRNDPAFRGYLTAWGLVMYLTFDRQNVGGREFRTYLTALANEQDAVSAFAQWLGGSLPDIERDWHNYLLELQPDGTKVKAIGEK